MTLDWRIPVARLLPILIFAACSASPASRPPLPAGKTGPLDVAEPVEVVTGEARKPERARWSWNALPQDVSPTGDLVYRPEPFRYEPGKAVRYIDFQAGDDANDGVSKTSAWKHHPWDPAASGKAKSDRGSDTYVFKRGVVYRGQLRPRDEKGVRLTSDPEYGAGEAVIAGSERISGWRRGARHRDVPNAPLVYWVDVPFLPRNVWEVRTEGIERVPLARTPNWKVSDPEDVMSEWWQWEQPEWWTGKHKIDGKGHRAHLGIDTKNLTQQADYYVGATLRTEYGIVMGTPFPTEVESFDQKRKGLAFQGIWFGDSETIITGNRYYLENKPQYLDSAGEFWFERKGDGGRLYLRLAGDRDPNQANVEVGRHIHLIEARTLENVSVSGLSFRFTNTHFDLHQAGWGHRDVANAAIRVVGQAKNLEIANCRFEHLSGKAVSIEPEQERIDGVVLRDNEVSYTDHGAYEVKANGPGDVKVLRNRLFMIGLRPHRQDHGHALVVQFPETMHVAGNSLERCYGAGIFLFGGKGSGDTREVPLSRSLVHHNRVVDSLLAANDWGGIETWQGGPHYVYGNISGNPNGFWNWSYKPGKGNARLGFAYYLDGSFKNYLFNNVAWGNTRDVTSKLCNASAFYEAVPTVENSLFNNTAYAFASGSSWSPAGGRRLVAGNLWLDIGSWVFMYGKLKEDKGPKPDEYPYESMAFARNVFHGTGEEFAVFEADGAPHKTPASMQTALERRGALASELGQVAGESPVRDASKHDFMPREGSAAIDAGVKVFVPWGLARTVGEWHFYRNRKNPALVFDHHFYMTPYLVHREDYHKAPRYDLEVVNARAESFIAGGLEDWTEGALEFDGRTQYALVGHDVMTRPYDYEMESKGKRSTKRASGSELATPDIDQHNLIVEAYFRTAAGHTSGVLVAKMRDAGYQLAVNKSGSLTFTIRSGGKLNEVAAGVLVNDGGWHHALAELDRGRETITLYVDGRRAGQAKLTLGRDASLSNDADLLVGRNHDGHYLTGALDFLRIARSSLTESKTSIEELYDWQLDGPFLRDFRGREPTGVRRDAGAFELPE